MRREQHPLVAKKRSGQAIWDLLFLQAKTYMCCRMRFLRQAIMWDKQGTALVEQALWQLVRLRLLQVPTEHNEAAELPCSTSAMLFDEASLGCYCRRQVSTTACVVLLRALYGRASFTVAKET